MGDVFAVLPFVNDAAIVTVTVTGDQVWAIAGGLARGQGCIPPDRWVQSHFRFHGTCPHSDVGSSHRTMAACVGQPSVR
jgi:hypothetical protein